MAHIFILANGEMILTGTRHAATAREMFLAKPHTKNYPPEGANMKKINFNLYITDNQWSMGDYNGIYIFVDDDVNPMVLYTQIVEQIKKHDVSFKKDKKEEG